MGKRAVTTYSLADRARMQKEWNQKAYEAGIRGVDWEDARKDIPDYFWQQAYVCYRIAVRYEGAIKCG